MHTSREAELYYAYDSLYLLHYLYDPESETIVDANEAEICVVGSTTVNDQAGTTSRPPALKN